MGRLVKAQLEIIGVLEAVSEGRVHVLQAPTPQLPGELSLSNAIPHRGVVPHHRHLHNEVWWPLCLHSVVRYLLPYFWLMVDLEGEEIRDEDKVLCSQSRTKPSCPIQTRVDCGLRRSAGDNRHAGWSTSQPEQLRHSLVAFQLGRMEHL